MLRQPYNTDYHALMVEKTGAFVTMIPCNLAPTSMNWYRLYVIACDCSEMFDYTFNKVSELKYRATVDNSIQHH
ncbi:Hypothetical protein PHPALM_19952 [Phytophthora palmivora]|uniref:Uncharacterized protein n=1 Tax=Phytophthora palmivora TaxID=4796 RepID=A0A2P4XG50_9STRA|nr:Hypothetical protein PHPALM_19952 [Phytophthora palmivora]